MLTFLKEMWQAIFNEMCKVLKGLLLFVTLISVIFCCGLFFYFLFTREVMLCALSIAGMLSFLYMNLKL